MPKPKKNSARTSGQQYREQILAKLNLAAEFEAMGVELVGAANEAGWMACRAVDREDSSPSAAVNVQSGHYRDLGGAGLFLGFFDFAVHLKKFSSWMVARDHYAAIAGVVPEGKPPRDPAEHLAFMPWQERTPGLWCLHKPGVTPESILAAGGRLAKYRDRYTVIALPIFGPGASAADPIGWLLYNATGGTLPIFHGKDKKTGELNISHKKVKMTGASEPGILGRHALERIREGGKFVVWKAEGPTDMLALWAAIPAEKRDRHLVVTNSNGCLEEPKTWMAGLFSGQLVAVVGDSDVPGQAGAVKWSAWIAKVAAEVRLVRPDQLGFGVTENHGRDLRDWLAGGEGGGSA